jgi:hypothetical protein
MFQRAMTSLEGAVGQFRHCHGEISSLRRSEHCEMGVRSSVDWTVSTLLAQEQESRTHPMCGLVAPPSIHLGPSTTEVTALAWRVVACLEERRAVR